MDVADFQQAVECVAKKPWLVVAKRKLIYQEVRLDWKWVGCSERAKPRVSIGETSGILQP